MGDGERDRPEARPVGERRTAKTRSVDEGRTLAGRYELGEVIGRGAMGTVYRAVDLILGRSVAVKTLPWLLADQDPNNIARFEREARAAAALSHPAVVSVYDTGVDERTHFIVMELVDGRSLQAILRDEGPLAPERAASVAGRVADALAAAHARGIVHRDIKPANVMVAKDGSVKVLDFGIARAAGSSTLTQGSSVIGTAAYMSPEQAVGKPADERSDIYALGCVLYALLTGRPPFSGEGSAAVMHQQANSAPRPPRAVGPRIPAALSGLVMEMLAKVPAERPQSAAEVRDQLRGMSGTRGVAAAETKPTVPLRPTEVTRRLPGVGAGLGGGAASAGAGAAGARAAEPSGTGAAGPGGARSPDRRGALVVGALVAGILLIALVALASGGSSPRPVAKLHGGRTATASTAAADARRRSAATKTATTATTALARTTPATGQSTTAASAAAPPPTVAAAADALTTLLNRDVTTGAINQQAAQQVAHALTDVFRSWDSGNKADAQAKLAVLSHQTAALAQQGAISAAALPALNGALANLGAALASASPPQAQTQPAPAGPAPPGADGKPPGHGGAPPGKVKKYGGGGDAGGH
ncbi:MAG TPA: protein kinase [Solirubrobacteraceae bacterium]|nr:protein kinase [Solirubrobacteraceae bacterium]